MRVTGRNEPPRTWEIKIVERRQMDCEICGARFSRRKTFRQKVNQTNKTHDGVPKTARQVVVSIREDIARWRPAPNCGKHEPTILKDWQ